MNNDNLNHILKCHPIKKTDIVSGKNTTLFDKNGKSFVDFEAGIWCTALGHCNPRINAAITDQMNKAMNLHYELTNSTAENLAADLLELLDFKDGKAVFLCSGSEAVEFSLRIARLISPSSKTLAFSTSYISVFSTSNLRNKELWTQVDFLKCSNCTNKKCSKECSLLENIDFNNIGVFLLESAACGRVAFPPYKLVNFLVNEVRSHGGLVVANEITTGFGRTGEWFGFNHYDIKPDIIAMGKGFGNGYPVSAVAMMNEVACKVENKNFIYDQSHQNDPLGCAVANEVIKIFKEDNMVARSKAIGEFFLSKLKELRSSVSIIKDVKGRGLMLALELSVDNSTEIVFEKMLEKGYFIGTTPYYNLLRFFPALTISENDIISMCDTLKDILLNLSMKK